MGSPMSGWGGVQTDCQCVYVVLYLHHEIQKRRAVMEEVDVKGAGCKFELVIQPTSVVLA